MLLKSKVFKIVLVFMFLIVGVSPALSDLIKEEDLPQLKKGQPIIVDGDQVEFFEETGVILADGNVAIEYGDILLRCDHIEVNTKLRQALCEGNVSIEQPDGILTGERIRYDFNAGKGEIIGAGVEAFPWFGYADETSKVGANEYLLKKGYITTCDLDMPHYRVKAGEIQIFPDEKIIAKNAFFYIGKVPVLWFPYYYHPIIQTKAKVQFIPGRSSDWGYFLLSAWRFYIKGETRVDALVDYRSKKGFAEGADLYYKLKDFGMAGLGVGIMRAYFVHQNDKGTYEPAPFRDEGDDPVLRKRFQWKHRIDFDDETVGMLEFNKVSDEYLLKDYFYDEYEETNRTPANYVSVISAKSNYTFIFEANKRFNDFYTVTQKLPEARLEMPDQRLWDTPFFYSTETSGTIFEKDYAQSNMRQAEHVNRFDSYHKLSYVTRLGPISFTPYGTFRETIYSRKMFGEDHVVSRETLGGGVNAFMRFHRVFDVKSDVMGLDINGLRHIVSPGAEYFNTQDPTIRKDELYQMDAIDEIEKTNGVTLSLENSVQIKRHNGNGELESVDLVRSSIGVNYYFRMEKDFFKFERSNDFKELVLDLELRPYSWLYIDSDLEIATKNQSVSKGSVEVIMHPSESLRVNMGYRYEKKLPRPRNQFTFDLDYMLNPKWRVGLYERFNLQDGSIEEQQFSITRDLHCWEVEFVYDLDGSNFLEDDFTLWLAFKIKAFPDLQLGLDRSFDKRSPGVAKTN